MVFDILLRTKTITSDAVIFFTVALLNITLVPPLSNTLTVCPTSNLSMRNKMRSGAMDQRKLEWKSTYPGNAAAVPPFAASMLFAWDEANLVLVSLWQEAGDQCHWGRTGDIPNNVADLPSTERMRDTRRRRPSAGKCVREKFVLAARCTICDDAG